MKTLPLFAAALALLAAGTATAGTPEQVATCAACHGADGKAIAPIYPHLAGQYSNYLEQALREYRSGERKNMIMGPQAKALTDADIRALAAYYAALPGPLYTPNVHAAHK
jgi:cytochrome c553